MTQLTAGLKQHEEEELVRLLSLVGQPWSTKFYNALAPLCVATTVELVCLTETEGTGELMVYLKNQPEDDKYWPGQPHSPGVVLRSTDESFDDAIARIIKTELACVVQQDHVRQVPHKNVVYMTKRGKETCRIYMVKLSGSESRELVERAGGFFGSVRKQRPELIPHHHFVIQCAVDRW
jgi:hypothetical protein